MTSPPSATLLPSAVIQHAYLQALLLLDEPALALAVVRQTLDSAGSQYAHAIKQAPQPLFQRLLLKQLCRAQRQRQWQHLGTSLRTWLIPPREADLTPGVLERWPVTTAKSADEWFAQAQSGGLILEVLRILPPRQRQSYWLRYVEDLPPLAVARILASTRYRVRRHAALALDTLTTILEMKGCPTDGLTKQQRRAGIAQALTAWLDTLPDPTQQALQTLGTHGQPSAAPTAGKARWRQFHALHPLGTRLMLTTGLLLLGLLAWQLAAPDDAAPPAQAAVQLLASDAPLSLLLDPRFEEASHD